MTIRVTRQGGAGLRHNDHHLKPSTKLEDGGSIMGLRPGGGLRPVVINRRYGKTCSVRQGSIEIRWEGRASMADDVTAGYKESRR